MAKAPADERRSVLSRFSVRFVLAALAGLAGIGLWGYLYLPYSLDSWVRSVQGRGYVLLEKVETPTMYVAVFDAGQSRCAVFCHYFGPDAIKSFVGTSITGEHGQPILDQVASQRLNGTEKRNPSEGYLFPIRKEFRGTIVAKVAKYQGAENGDTDSSMKYIPVGEPTMLLELRFSWPRL